MTSRRRRHRHQTNGYQAWLTGVFLSYGVIGVTLFAFAPPWWIWLMLGLSILMLTHVWEEVGIFLLAIALVVGINWTLDSDLSLWAELLLSTIVSVLMAGAVGLLVAEARSQLQATFASPNCGLILLSIAGLGLGVGSLIGFALPF